MACGRPVVTTPQCAWGLEPCGRHIVIEARRDQFLDALGAMIEDGSQQRLLGEAGRAYVERCHDWESIAPQMLELLARVAQQQRSMS